MFETNFDVRHMQQVLLNLNISQYKLNWIRFPAIVLRAITGSTANPSFQIFYDTGIFRKLEGHSCADPKTESKTLPTQVHSCNTFRTIKYIKMPFVL